MDVHMVLAESRYQCAKEHLRLFAVGFVCAAVFAGYLANFYVG